MKITAPISQVDEIAPLLSAGAHELYCGVVAENWVKQFNTGAVNRRYFGNLHSLVELQRAIDAAHDGGAGLFLVLNAQHYGDAQLDALISLALCFHEMGGDAVIVADPTFISVLREAIPKLAIHVSSVASCRNSAAVGFYRALGVRRVILPRDVSLDEIEVITRRCRDIEIEVFILNDGCVFEEGVCHSIHLPKKLGGPICVADYAFEYRGASGAALSPRVAERLSGNDDDYQRWLWYRFGCAFSTTDEGYPYGPCGLCAIHRLHEMGVAAIKIAGREGATARKIKSVQMVSRVLEEVVKGGDAQSVASCAVNIRKTPQHCQTGYMCYYPEVKWK